MLRIKNSVSHVNGLCNVLEHTKKFVNTKTLLVKAISHTEINWNVQELIAEK